MGIKKHGTSDNTSGLPKGAKNKLRRVNQEQAQRQKNSRQNNDKATNQQGNKKTR